MSVYTPVADDVMRQFLMRYDLGELISLKGIAQGITNTNYFIDTTNGRFILTLFETLTLEQLPFYLQLTNHLNEHKIACPAPIPQKNGLFCDILCEKPAAIISFLNGADIKNPNEQQCFSVGEMLAKMHIAGQTFPLKMENARYQKWWSHAACQLASKITNDDYQLLNEEIQLIAQHPSDHLPGGIIHADLFKDNVLMDKNSVCGFIDFYYACNGSFIYDLAITLNDWARDSNNQLNPDLQSALLSGYQSVRPLIAEENKYLPIAQRAAAIRFWVSRLWDACFPIEGEMTFIKDPNEFKNLLISLK